MIKRHHHISMYTKDLKENNHFYTEVLGLRRVKVSVNQNDHSMYHVFYGDSLGTSGNDITYFDMPYVADRYYFESLYFREDNGVIFEIVGPEAKGFTVDTDESDLGTRLDLPPALEEKRDEIESRLTPIRDWTQAA